MKGQSDIVTCQICNIEMTFGRLQCHIKARHKEIEYKEYVNNFWKILPLHHLCIICNKNVVYKYKTCSKECRFISQSSNSKGNPKPIGFMNQEQKNKIGKGNMGKIGGFTGYHHNEENMLKHSLRMKGQKLHLGFSQSDFQKSQASKSLLKYYKNGGEPWTKNNPHTQETLKKIFSTQRMNKLEYLVFNFLKQNNIGFEYQFPISKDNKRKIYDFKIDNILLEIDGDFYHGGPGVEKHFFKLNEVKINDLFKTNLAEQNGYKVIRIWESEIKKDSNVILKRINECI